MGSLLWEHVDNFKGEYAVYRWVDVKFDKNNAGLDVQNVKHSAVFD